MSAKRRVRNQTLGGIGLVLFGLFMLSNARWALRLRSRDRRLEPHLVVRCSSRRTFFELLSDPQWLKFAPYKIAALEIVLVPDEALLFVIVLLVGAVYTGTYIWLRTSHVERWDRDSHIYVILPQSRLVYYVYRPLTYIDAHLTGMRFHIGPHY